MTNPNADWMTAQGNLAAWFAEVLEHVNDYAKTDWSEDDIADIANHLATFWREGLQATLEHGRDGRVEESVDRAEQKALELLSILRSFPAQA